MCMYMSVVVSSGSSVRIFIILGNLMIPRLRVPRGSSIRILYPRESYDSWADPYGLSEYHKMLLLHLSHCVAI
jgi:hypothetical protein